jgi:hypothetical protein
MDKTNVYQIDVCVGALYGAREGKKFINDSAAGGNGIIIKIMLLSVDNITGQNDETINHSN